MRYHIFTRSEIAKTIADLQTRIARSDRSAPGVPVEELIVRDWQWRLDHYDQYIAEMHRLYGEENCVTPPVQTQSALFLPFITAGIGDIGDLVDLINYFAIVVTDGDWLNDHLVDLPVSIAPAVQTLGQWLAQLLGS